MKWSLSEFLNELELRGQTWCIVECDAAGGFSTPPDDRLRFYAVLEGTVRLAGIERQPICISKGEVAFILSGEAHALRVAPDSRTTLLDFMRDGSHPDIPPVLTLGNGGETVSRILCGRLKVRWPGGLLPAAIPPVLTLDSSVGLISLSDLAGCATGVGAAGLLTRIASYMLAQAFRHHAAHSDSFPLSATDDPVARALQIIDQHPSQPWTVSSLALKVGMGRSNFATRFAEFVGGTPMEMLANRRMHFAEDLLHQQKVLKISEIATRVGYRSEAAFIRRFVRHFGMTPGRMRSAAASKTEAAAAP